MQSKNIKKLIRNNPDNSYILINLCIAGVIVSILIYSGIFSAGGFSHPIKSMHSQPVASTGLSRAFSELMRGHYSQAIQYNKNSLRIFLFFIIQLILRMMLTILLFRNIFSKNKLLIADILIAVLLFLWAFLPLILAQLQLLLSF